LRFFALLDFRYYVLAVFLGLITVLIIYISFKRTPAEEEEDRGDFMELPEEPSVAQHPIPPILLFIYIGVVIWSILYVIFWGILGEPI